MSQKYVVQSNIQEQLTNILVRAFAIVGGSTLAIQILRGDNRSESIDRAIYLIGLITAAYFYFSIMLSRKFQVKGSLVASSVALLALAIGIFGVEQHDPINGVVLSNRLWLGFGPFVLLLVLLIAPFAWYTYRWVQVRNFLKPILGLIALTSFALASLSFWQDNNSVIDPDHSEYVLNEVLSIPSGSWPFSDFIPQYQTLFTFLVAPFSGALAASQITQIAFALMFICSIMALVLGFFLVRRTLPSKSIALSILLVVPLTALTQFPTREGYLGSISALLSGLAIRVFPGMVLISSFILILINLNSPSISKRITVVILGVFTGLNMWSSQDFGIASSLLVALLPLLLKYDEKWKRNFFATHLWGGAIFGFFIYPLVSMLFGYPVNFSFFAFFARQFGGGFGAENIRTPGPVLVILPLIIGLIAVHSKLIVHAQSVSDPEKRRTLFYTGVLGFAFSSWAALGFNYFLNRSYASGQLQILFILVAVALAAFVGGYLQLQTEVVQSPPFKFKSSLKLFARPSSNLFVAMLISLPLATLVLTPNPVIELDRINSSKDVPRWPKASVISSIEDAQAGVAWAKINGSSIAFFGASANYVSKETGIQSASILNSPFDTLMSQQTIDTTCAFLTEVNADYLVLSDEGAAMFRFKDNTLCERYAFADIPEVRSGRFAKKIG